MRLLLLLMSLCMLIILASCGGDNSNENQGVDISVPEPLHKVAFVFDNSEQDVLTRRSATVFKLEDATGVQTSAGLEIELEENGALLIYNRELEVTVGDEYKAEVIVDAIKEGPLTLRIARSCSLTEYEEARVKVQLDKGLNNISTSHVFENNHGCARITLDTDFETAEFILKSAKLINIIG